MWAKPPEVPAAKAVWIASAATDGKTGEIYNILTPAQLLGGALREAGRRLFGKRQAAQRPAIRRLRFQRGARSARPMRREAHASGKAGLPEGLQATPDGCPTAFAHCGFWPWHCLNLRPLPQGQGSLRPRLASSAATHSMTRAGKLAALHQLRHDVHGRPHVVEEVIQALAQVVVPRLAVT